MQPYRKPNTERLRDADIETFGLIHKKAAEFVQQIYAELGRLNFRYTFDRQEALLQAIKDVMHDCCIPRMSGVEECVDEAEREYICEAEDTWSDMAREERKDRSLGL